MKEFQLTLLSRTALIQTLVSFWALTALPGQVMLQHLYWVRIFFSFWCGILYRLQLMNRWPSNLLQFYLYSAFQDWLQTVAMMLYMVTTVEKMGNVSPKPPNSILGKQLPSRRYLAIGGCPSSTGIFVNSSGIETAGDLEIPQDGWRVCSSEGRGINL